MKINQTDLMDFIDSKRPDPIVLSVKQIGRIFKGRLTVVEIDNRLEIKNPQYPNLTLLLPLDLPDFIIPYNIVCLTESGKSVRFGLSWDSLCSNIYFEEACEELDKQLFRGSMLMVLNPIFGTKLFKLPMQGVIVPQELQDLIGSPFAYRFELRKYKSKIIERVNIIRDFLQIINY
jgi:hypothetical protein